MSTLIDLLFVPVYGGLLYLQWRVREPFIRPHTAFFVTFCPLLHVATIALLPDAHTSSAYGETVAHLIVSLYLLIFYLGSIAAAPYLLRGSAVSSLADRVSPGAMALALVTWLGIRLYLISKYGFSAFISLRGLAGDEMLLYLDPLDTAISVYSGYLAVGAVVAYLFRLINGTLRWPHPLALLVVVFLVTYVVTGETTLGARRFILLYMILGLSAFVGRRSNEGERRLSAWRFSRWAVLGILVVAGFSAYYQAVRNNFFSPTNIERFTSGRTADVLLGITDSVLPRGEVEPDEDKPEQLREGPFELISAVSDRLLDSSNTVGGEILTNSLEMVIPRVLLEREKTSFNVDATLSTEFGLPDTDLSTSLPVIFMADFGLMGAPLAPIAMVLAIFVYALALKKLGPVSPAYTLVTFGVIYQTLGIVEGDLVGLFSPAREFIALLILVTVSRVLIFATHWVLEFSIGRGSRKPV